MMPRQLLSWEMPFASPHPPPPHRRSIINLFPSQLPFSFSSSSTPLSLSLSVCLHTDMEALLVHKQTGLHRPGWVHPTPGRDRGGHKPPPPPLSSARPGKKRLRVPHGGGRLVVGMMAKLKEKGAETAGEEAAAAYRDSWFDRLAIRHLTQSIQMTTGLRTRKEGYEGLVEAASMVARHFDHEAQQELVTRSLNRAFPSPLMALIRTLLPQSKFTREYLAFFTTIFFTWLIGPCEVKESVLDGRPEKNVVHIKKCRFLEGTNCVGMCTNMCKMPSQAFIKNSLGVPVNMVPNFQDMSCEMIFGQYPPAAADDPALAQPCHHFSCKAKQVHGVDCSSI